MIIKRDILPELFLAAKKYPVVTITGPRQSGKTTLAKTAFPKKPYLSMEDPDVRNAALSDPRAFFSGLKTGAIIDEIQKAPELLSYIQGIVDNSNRAGQFILTGSQQFEVVSRVAQSLAGRTAMLKLLPFTIKELSNLRRFNSVDEYLLNGFYPRVHDKKIEPVKAYKDYFETYIQRDLRQLINVKDLNLFQKFVRLCAGRIGSIFIASNLANEVGVSVTTIQSWLSILEASYIVFLLQPYYENIGKRLIKSSKLYFYDVGIASYLLGIENLSQVQRDPLRGGLIENLVLMELVKQRYNSGRDHNMYFFRDSHHNEVDIIFKSAHMLIPYEIKSAQTFHPDFMKTLQYLSDLFPGRVKNGYLVYTGDLEQKSKQFSLINFVHAADTL